MELKQQQSNIVEKASRLFEMLGLKSKESTETLQDYDKYELIILFILYTYAYIIRVVLNRAKNEKKDNYLF